MKSIDHRIVIRDARPDEREAVAALTLRVYADFASIMTPGAWAGLDGAVRVALASDGPVERIVAERDGEIVGCVHLYPPATAAYGDLAESGAVPELRLLAVAPEARGAGVGQALVEECVRRARLTGAPALGLHSSKSMAPAIRMYERLGFVRAPETDFFPPDGEHVMGYRLPLA